MIRRSSKVVATDSAYIDPIGCESTVSYKVISNPSLSGLIQLSDCKAIEMLQDFRAAFAAAQAASKPKRLLVKGSK
jgi:hypothetical protein